jgi:hypothetical protein
LGETYGLENSEDCPSAGGHGNQHVRLRGAQIDRIEAICPAPEATSCFEPRQASMERILMPRGFDGFAFSSVHPDPPSGFDGSGLPKTLFNQG